MRLRGGRSWRLRHGALLGILLATAGWTQRAPLGDMIALGIHDEEQSHIFLAPLIALWLVWLRRSRLRYVRFRPGAAGPLIVTAGWLLSWWGFQRGIQVAWHAGALLTLLGAATSVTGLLPFRLFAPAVTVLGFALPVPGTIRHEIAYPLQELATTFTHAMLELFGFSAVRSGNVLIINGEDVAVGEACNGMRLVFALTLIVYAFAFGTPLKPFTRIVLIALSPFVAMICNVVRLVPTSLLFGYGDVEAAQRFHDVAGWLMLPAAVVMLMVLLRTIRWLEFPVTSYRLASQ